MHVYQNIFGKENGLEGAHLGNQIATNALRDKAFILRPPFFRQDQGVGNIGFH